MDVFMSYARNDGDVVAKLRVEFEAMGGAVWMDSRLSGGQDWWSAILAAVRDCDFFVLAVSRASIASEACMYETNYAIRLGRPVLPVVVAPVDLAVLPDELKRFQTVTFVDSTLDAIRSLAKALLNQKAAPPLPDPLPEPPPMPQSYGDDYRRRLAAASMTMDDQIQLAALLKSHVTHPIHGVSAGLLLAQLRARPDVVLAVAHDIDQFLSPVAPAARESETPPVPNKSRPSPPRDWDERLTRALADFKTKRPRE